MLSLRSFFRFERIYCHGKKLCVQRSHAAGPQTGSRIEKPLPSGQIEITARWQIALPEDELLATVAKDLQDYFAVSMGLSLALCEGEASEYAIAYKIDPSLEGDGSYRVAVTEKQVCLVGKDAR
ncbi:MAG: hypothetical protein IJF31_00025, partial [Clostridia bacterium]|nr:hypothetical protein [Clostridia bacterium]